MDGNYRGDVDATEFLEALGLGEGGPPKPGTPPLQAAFSGGFPDPAAGMGGLQMESKQGGSSSDVMEALSEFVEASKAQVSAAQKLMKAIQADNGGSS